MKINIYKKNASNDLKNQEAEQFDYVQDSKEKRLKFLDRHNETIDLVDEDISIPDDPVTWKDYIRQGLNPVVNDSNFEYGVNPKVQSLGKTLFETRQTFKKITKAKLKTENSLIEEEKQLSNKGGDTDASSTSNQ